MYKHLDELCLHNADFRQTTTSDADKEGLTRPVELVIGSPAKNKDRANDFVDWLIREDGGQVLVKTFLTNGANGVKSQSKDGNEASNTCINTE